MPLEYQMANEPIEDVEAIELLLRAQWEPFAVYKGEVWFKRMYHNEDREPQSSTRHSNWMGNEPDAADMVEE
jgi:hypothetical protein